MIFEKNQYMCRSLVVVAALAVHVTVINLLSCCRANILDLYGKEKVDTRHRVIKVDHNILIADFGDDAVMEIALLIAQWDGLAEHQHILCELAIDHEDIHWEQRHGLLIIIAIRLCRRDTE